jgi:hypothetical protein
MADKQITPTNPVTPPPPTEAAKNISRTTNAKRTRKSARKTNRPSFHMA